MNVTGLPQGWSIAPICSWCSAVDDIDIWDSAVRRLQSCQDLLRLYVYLFCVCMCMFVCFCLVVCLFVRTLWLVTCQKYTIFISMAADFSTIFYFSMCNAYGFTIMTVGYIVCIDVRFTLMFHTIVHDYRSVWSWLSVTEKKMTSCRDYWLCQKVRRFVIAQTHGTTVNSCASAKIRDKKTRGPIRPTQNDTLTY